MSVAGIDYSTKEIVIVVLEDDSNNALAYRWPIEHPAGSFYAARNVFAELPRRSWFEDKGIWLAGLERPMSRRLVALAALSRIQGAIAASLPLDLTVVETPPSEWMRVFTGRPAPRSTEQRKAAVAATCDALDWWSNNVDSRDAYGIAWAVRALNEQGIRDAKEAA